jgi:hypothetical protein
VLDARIAGVDAKIDAVQTQVSGAAPPVTAGVRAELVHVHFELNRVIDKVDRRTRLTFWVLVFVMCMQAVIIYMMYNNGQAPPVEAPALRDVPRHRLLCDVVRRNPHYDGDGVVVCQYLPVTPGDGQVIWTAMQSSWTYLQQSLRNMSQTQ